LLKSHWQVYALAVVLTVALTLAVYPGFMSWDSLHALEGARFGNVGGDYPPFVSYIWRILDQIYPDPAVMHVAQNGLLLISVAHVLVKTGLPVLLQCVLLVSFVATPVLFGPMLVIWKDIPVASCFAASAAILLSIPEQISEKRRLGLLALVPVFLFGGAAYRFNAASVLIPLLGWWAIVATPGLTAKPRSQKWGLRVAVALIAFAGIMGAVKLVNTWKIPELTRLPPNEILSSIMVYDLFGMTAMSGEMLLPVDPQSPSSQMTVELAKKIYSPEHANITFDRIPAWFDLTQRGLNADVPKTWLHAILARPDAYVAHRVAVSRVLIGATPGQMFYPIHLGVDANDMGITYTPNFVGKALVHYQEIAAWTIFCRPWPYYILNLVICALCLVQHSPRRFHALTLELAGLFYIVPQFIVTPAGDLRYNFWAIVATLLGLFLYVGSFRKDKTTYQVPRHSDFNSLNGDARASVAGSREAAQ